MSVHVISGANDERLNVAGQTVGQVRSRFSTALNIPSGTPAQINGSPASEADYLQDGDTLNFVKTSAEKG